MRLRHILFSTSLVAGTIGAGLPAAAQLQELMDGVGFGREKDPIEYRQRAPLVVPPNLNLRQPEERPVAAREGKWPNDPDVAKKKAANEEIARPRVSDPNLGKNPQLSVDEIRAGRVAGAGVADRGPVDTRTEQDKRGWINPDVVQAQGANFRGKNDAPLLPGQEPKRKYLTDPPPGIRAAAAGAPVKATPEKGKNLDEEASPYFFLNPKKQED